MTEPRPPARCASRSVDSDVGSRDHASSVARGSTKGRGRSLGRKRRLSGLASSVSEWPTAYWWGPCSSTCVTMYAGE